MSWSLLDLVWSGHGPALRSRTIRSSTGDNSLVLIDVVDWDQSSCQATAVAAAQYYANAANAAMNAAAGGGNPRMMLAPGQVAVSDMHFEILKFISWKTTHVRFLTTISSWLFSQMIQPGMMMGQMTLPPRYCTVEQELGKINTWHEAWFQWVYCWHLFIVAAKPGAVAAAPHLPHRWAGAASTMTGTRETMRGGGGGRGAEREGGGGAGAGRGVGREVGRGGRAWIGGRGLMKTIGKWTTFYIKTLAFQQGFFILINRSWRERADEDNKRSRDRSRDRSPGRYRERF